MSAAQDELTKALSCLFIAVDSSVAMDVGTKVRAVIDEKDKRIAVLERILKEQSAQRDGNWCDKMGCCKVCDGEIPHGHRDNCDLWKHEQRLTEARRIIERIGTTGVERTEIIQAAEKWLEGKP